MYWIDCQILSLLNTVESNQSTNVFSAKHLWLLIGQCFLNCQSFVLYGSDKMASGAVTVFPIYSSEASISDTSFSLKVFTSSAGRVAHTWGAKIKCRTTESSTG